MNGRPPGKASLSYLGKGGRSLPSSLPSRHPPFPSPRRLDLFYPGSPGNLGKSPGKEERKGSLALK